MKSSNCGDFVACGALCAALLLVGCGDDDGDGGGPDGGADSFGPGGSANTPQGDGFGPGAVTATDCGAACRSEGVGEGGDGSFDLAAGRADGVALDDDGALVLARGAASAGGLIWVANTEEGTVSKVDTGTLQELGRYRVPYDHDLQPKENGPSRTSVDSDGNVYAGARIGNTLTKISALGERCPDTNGDGMITTSVGPQEVLPEGEDDCVIWSTDIGGDGRGVAVQETPSQYMVLETPDAETEIVEIPGERFVWTGGREVVQLHKLDAETGEILFTLAEPPTPIYGLALDGLGNLWTVSQREMAIGRIDTTRCVDASCNDEPICTTACSESSCPSTCDEAVVERIELPTSGYGITVDCDQRVWVGGAHGGDGVKRYDQTAAADQRLTVLPDVAGDGQSGIHGIAADARGWVWGAARDMGVWRIDANTLEYQQVAGTGGGDWSAKGMAVDRQGRVWAIPFRMDYAMVITPGDTIDSATVDKPIGGFVGPYTYSDMTGEQRRLAANEPGSYRQLFEGCEGQDATVWADLEWDAQAPEGTRVIFLVRSADTLSELEQASWAAAGSVPSDNALANLQQFLPSSGRYLEVEVKLFSEDAQPVEKGSCEMVVELTPKVRSFRATHTCAEGVE